MTTEVAKAGSTKVITGKVRLCWPQLFEPATNFENQDPRFSVMALIPKSDTATLERLRAAEAIATENGKPKWGGKIPRELKKIIHDADEDGTAEDYPERKGHYYMTVGSGAKYRPGVVDQLVNPIMDQSEIYSGVYARLSLNAYPYNANGTKGVTFGLNHVQKLADGEPLDGRTSAEDDFEAVESELI